jgi:hypothetical protein
MSVSARTIADLVDSFPEAWFHEPGDKLVGDIIEIGTGENEYGTYDLITVLVTEPGSTERGGQAIPVGSLRVWHAFDTVPKNELKKRSPRVGDRIAIKDFGVRDGKHYKAYRIIVQRKTATDDAEGTEPVPNGPAGTTPQPNSAGGVPPDVGVSSTSATDAVQATTPPPGSPEGTTPPEESARGMTAPTGAAESTPPPANQAVITDEATFLEALEELRLEELRQQSEAVIDPRYDHSAEPLADNEAPVEGGSDIAH